MRRNLLLLSVLLPLQGTALAVEPATDAAPGDLHGWCRSVTRAIPQIKPKTCLAAELKPVARSVNGRHIMVSEFKPARTASPRVLVVGGIHGDELTSVSIVFRWIELLQQPAGQVAQYEWRVIPVLNPDGLLAKRPTRVNARGVDLNRNFPTEDWSSEAPRYWQVSTRKDPRRFPGTQPVSEPESRWLHNEIKAFKPDVIISVHAPHDVLDFDGPPDVKPPARFGPLRLNRLGVYPGSLGNYGGLKEGIPVVTLELPHALEMPTEEDLAHVWRDMQDWLKVNLVDAKPAPPGRTTEPSVPLLQWSFPGRNVESSVPLFGSSR
ncbi:MAG TPA: M14 family murein peptide amidase A [Burkholderiales bacterium]|nr:M14 family murein peptide amidase A [Burkholderiales bacterium]